MKPSAAVPIVRATWDCNRRIGRDPLRQSQLPHLRDDQRRIDQQPMDMHHVGIRRPQLQQHARELGGLWIIRLEQDDLTAGLFERSLVQLRGVDAGLVIDVQHCAAAFFQLVIGVFRQCGDIDLGEREQRVDIVAEFRDVGRIGTDRKLQHLFTVGHWRLSLHDRAPCGDEHWDFVDCRQSVGGIDAKLRRGLGVDHHQFQRMAVDPAGIVDVLCRHAHGGNEVGAIAGFGTSQRLGDA